MKIRRNIQFYGLFLCIWNKQRQEKAGSGAHRADGSPSLHPAKTAKKRVVSPLFGFQPAECLKFYKPPGKRYPSHRSVPTQGIYLHPRNAYTPAPQPPNGCEAALCKTFLPPKNNKNFPHVPATTKSETNFRLVNSGDMGEVLGERGRFEGREPPLSRGGSLPPRSSPHQKAIFFSI